MYICNHIVTQSHTMRRDVFQAIADPTRREILNLLAQQPLNLNAVAARFDVSRPAISKHIKILTQCGLVKIRQQGRERFCEAQLDKLSEVHEWAGQYSNYWADNLDALEHYLNELRQQAKENYITGIE